MDKEKSVKAYLALTEAYENVSDLINCIDKDKPLCIKFKGHFQGFIIKIDIDESDE